MLPTMLPSSLCNDMPFSLSICEERYTAGYLRVVNPVLNDVNDPGCALIPEYQAGVGVTAWWNRHIEFDTIDALR